MILVGHLWELESVRGTLSGLQSFIYSASNYHSVVLNGANQLLAVDDSEFANGAGHWKPVTSAVTTTIINFTVATPDIFPAQNPYTNVVVRKYTGSAAAIPVGVATAVGWRRVADATRTTDVQGHRHQQDQQHAANSRISDGIQLSWLQQGCALQFDFWMLPPAR